MGHGAVPEMTLIENTVLSGYFATRFVESIFTFLAGNACAEKREKSHG